MKRMGEDDLRQRKHKKIDRSDDIRNSFSFGKRQLTGFYPNSVGFGFLIILVILINFFYIFENTLPDHLKIKDAESHPGRFIGQRAELQLKRLTNLGTRVVGSYENEVLAVDFLKREISFITQEAKKVHTIEVDVQKPTGSYYLSLRPHSFRNFYANIQNIVVKLSSGYSPNSILMNCHYDTVPESPGASDNGLNCVVMLEILRVLASEATPLKNSVIFLFNGAEENPLQASHGFLSQHKWRKEVKVVINLDSAGAGGREILFQTSGEPWLVKAYAKAVPRPSAAVQAEELFHHGVIPSDTDFRIFRDFGGYPGFDIAHCTNGYVYHTKFDTTHFIQPGVYQNTGDNMLALVRELVNSSQLTADHRKTRIVYFDVFTLFMLVYTEEVSLLVNLATALVSLFAVYRSHRGFCTQAVVDLKLIRRAYGHSVLLSEENRFSLKALCFSVGMQLLGLLAAAAAVFVMAKTLDHYNSTMSWYLRPSLVIPLYCFPILTAVGTVLASAQSYIKNELVGYKVIYFIDGAQVLWTVLLIAGTVKGIRSSFIIMLAVLFPSVGIILLSFFKGKMTVKAFTVTFLVSSFPPLLYLISMSVKVFTVIIPMTARMGPHTNPEMVIGALAFLTSALYVSQAAPFLLLLKKTRKFLITLCIIQLITVVGVVQTKFGFPYSGDARSPALQRFYVLHCERTFHDAKGAVRRQDSGIFVQSLDRNNLNFVSKFIPEVETARRASDDCPKEVFCGFPVFTSRFIRPAPYSHWLPAAPPTIHHPTSLEVVHQAQVLVNVRRLRILVTGPDHMTLGLSPRQGVELLKWSFDDAVPVNLEEADGRKTYMVYYSHGLTGGSLEFEVDLGVRPNQVDQLMDVALVGHYMHDKKIRTSEFRALISKFPEWAHVTAWTTTYKSWEI